MYPALWRSSAATGGHLPQAALRGARQATWLGDQAEAAVVSITAGCQAMMGGAMAHHCCTGYPAVSWHIPQQEAHSAAAALGGGLCPQCRYLSIPPLTRSTLTAGYHQSHRKAAKPAVRRVASRKPIQ
ncbi:hypothetical protein NDU88_005124 [Pleurodeles waltl]|uniref:Uncharacterized protein n=1 Tax=Pleurodeles waltl TaxID=8319 RepID=A0AAV7RJ97_PLEWA|nr:hypothetical protein NDU88_005124 [Pleurodeles waltl]